ncbi:MAG TPA: hypothetical protein VIN67_09215, partial [Desulfobaccales bacterium]
MKNDLVQKAQGGGLSRFGIYFITVALAQVVTIFTAKGIGLYDRKGANMSYAAKDFSFLLGMKGFSDTLLKNHFTLYQGYVANTNKLMDLLAAMQKAGKEGTPEFAELKRRFGWEFNG